MSMFRTGIGIPLGGARVQLKAGSQNSLWVPFFFHQQLGDSEDATGHAARLRPRFKLCSQDREQQRTYSLPRAKHPRRIHRLLRTHRLGSECLPTPRFLVGWEGNCQASERSQNRDERLCGNCPPSRLCLAGFLNRTSRVFVLRDPQNGGFPRGSPKKGAHSLKLTWKLPEGSSKQMGASMLVGGRAPQKRHTPMAVAQKTGTKMEHWKVETWTNACISLPVSF